MHSKISPESNSGTENKQELSDTLNIKALAKANEYIDDTYSDESSSIHSKIDVDDGSVSSKKKYRKPISLLVQQRNETRDRIINEVLNQILPEFSKYHTENELEQRKKKKKNPIVRAFIYLMKFLGVLSSDIHDAVLSGGTAQVIRTLKKIHKNEESESEILNSYNEQGMTPLTLAAKINDADVVGLLLENGAIADFMDENSGRNALFYSVLNKNIRMTKMLLHAKIDANSVDFECITPLMIAASQNDVNSCKLLVHAMADVDLQDEQGWTVLHHAANTGSTDSLLYLLSQGANRKKKDNNKRKAVHIAKYKGHGNCVAALMDKRTFKMGT